MSRQKVNAELKTEQVKERKVTGVAFDLTAWFAKEETDLTLNSMLVRGVKDREGLAGRIFSLHHEEDDEFNELEESVMRYHGKEFALESIVVKFGAMGKQYCPMTVWAYGCPVGEEGESLNEYCTLFLQFRARLEG